MSFKRKLLQKLQYWIRPYFTYKAGVKVSIWATGVHHVTFEGGTTVPEFCGFSDRTHIGFRSTLGTNNFFGGKVKLGKYCQIGRDVAFHPTNHPISHVSTYINAQLFEGNLKKFKTEQEIVLGNDVWVGHGVIVLSGVRVGNGAILAAGSVVTRDVSPYSIVAGNPAKEVRKRFSDQVISELEDLNWWDMSESELQRIKPLFLMDLSEIKSVQAILKALESTYS